MTDFARTVVAADKWLREHPAREAAIDRALAQPDGDSIMKAWQEQQDVQKQADDELRRAFHEDTQAYNSLDNCMRVDPHFILDIARRYRGKEANHDPD